MYIFICVLILIIAIRIYIEIYFSHPFIIVGAVLNHTFPGSNDFKHLYSKRSRSLEAIFIETDNEKLNGIVELKERSRLVNGVRLKGSDNEQKIVDTSNMGTPFSLVVKSYSILNIVYIDTIIIFTISGVGLVVKSKERLEDPAHIHGQDKWQNNQEQESHMFDDLNE